MGRILRGALSAFFARLLGPGLVHWFEANPWIWWVIAGGAAFIAFIAFVAFSAAEAAASAAYYGARSAERNYEPDTTVVRDDDDATEIIYWRSIANSTDPTDFVAYLDEYPAGNFRALARNRLEQLVPQDRA